VKAEAPRRRARTSAALVYGLIGLLICGMVFGAVAISKAQNAKKTIQNDPRYGGEGLATAGFVLGIIDIIGWFVLLILRVSRM
jgi:ABC-type phosphate transport system permease subunit